MFTSNLDEREVQLLIVALRYWRTHRAGGVTRRTDPEIAPDTLDILLAKLTATAQVGSAPAPAADVLDLEIAPLDR